MQMLWLGSLVSLMKILKFVEKTFNVKIFQNGNNLKNKGNKKDVNLSVDALRNFMKQQAKELKLIKKLFICAYKSQIKKTKVIETVIKTPKKSYYAKRKKSKNLY